MAWVRIGARFWYCQFSMIQYCKVAVRFTINTDLVELNNPEKRVSSQLTQRENRPYHLLALPPQHWEACLAFYVSIGDPNSGPHVCVVSGSLIAPSPIPCGSIVVELIE